ncbi:hypothetical protein G6F54_014059 [Rhizopus delemar]|nr:hypothetical protein G6F54_014059 [Rhizopus delemar]
MGYGVPAAIGAQVAHPDKTVVCVSGDASVLMNIQELSTAMQHQTPVKVVLCNNGYMGMPQLQRVAARFRGAGAGVRLGRSAGGRPGKAGGRAGRMPGA